MEAAGSANALERDRGGTVGLTTGLEAWFDGRIKAQRYAGGTPCPGEDVCAIIGPIARFPDTPIEDVCAGCAKRETKPGSEPRGYADAIAEALTLDEYRAIGATFAYPDALSSYQWACLRALERAREKEKERIQRESTPSNEQARIAARVGQPMKR